MQFLRENAGKVPKRDICQMLKRSSASVSRKAAELRWQGGCPSLKYYVPTMEPCPSCGKLSATINRTGMCEPCRRRDQLAGIHAQIADLMAQLTPEDRDTYERMESKVESTLEPLPEPPDTSRMTPYRRAYREEMHAAKVEQVVASNLRRQVKAAQKRKERIREKVETMASTKVRKEKK